MAIEADKNEEKENLKTAQKAFLCLPTSSGAP